MTIKSFTKLIAWQKAHKLVLLIYQLSEKFPQKEIFGLTQQIKRAAVSITSNIAEGFCRISKKEKIKFYYISLGSTSEIQNQLLIGFDLKYINKKELNKTAGLSIEVSKLINSLIKTTKSKIL